MKRFGREKLDHSDLIERLRENGKLTRDDATFVLNQVFQCISEAINDPYVTEIAIKDIGKIKVVKVKPTPYRSLKTGKMEMSDETVRLTFTQFKSSKERMKQSRLNK